MSGVSVIIPTFNRARLVRRALASVLAQTFRELEAIVVDDCSSDATESSVAAFEDARVRYVRLPRNGGVAVARNSGLREACGEFVAFLDSDDEWRCDKLQLQLQAFHDASDDVGLIYTGVEKADREGVREVVHPTFRGDIYPEMLVRNVIDGGGSSVMIRRRVVEHVGLMDELLPAIEDYDYWLRIARCYRIDFVDQPLVRYHDPADGHAGETQVRKSLHFASNLRARELFFGKHAEEMRRFGVADRFLLNTAKRCRRAGRNEEARRLAWLALRENFLAADAYLLLAYLYSPSPAQKLALSLHRLLGSGPSAPPQQRGTP